MYEQRRKFSWGGWGSSKEKVTESGALNHEAGQLEKKGNLPLQQK